MALVEDPFSVAEYAVDAPVNEHAELHVLKFTAGLQVFRGRMVVLGEGLICRESAGDGAGNEYESHNDRSPRV